jgi:hypothetical protein
MKPILFNTEMVRKILSGEKTVTRRRVKPAHLRCLDSPYRKEHPEVQEKQILEKLCEPPYKEGDVLYVREKFACDGFDGEEYIYVYWTEVDECDRVVWGDPENSEWAPSSDYHWQPSIHMPKEAARIFLRVTGVRVERLQEIDGKGRKAEGAESRHGFGATYGAFVELWNSTIKPEERELYGWEANPWVWVIEFERCEKPEEGVS